MTRREIMIENAKTGATRTLSVTPRMLRWDAETLFRRHLLRPPDWRIVDHAPRLAPTGDIRRVAVLSMGGLGDDLIKLNVLRQLSRVLKHRHPDCAITYVGRQDYSIFRVFDFVDHWRFVPQYGVTELSPLIADDYDLTFDLRYKGVVLRPGERWMDEPLAGKNIGEFIGSYLPKTLDDYAFGDDGQYLADYLARIEPTESERESVRPLCDPATHVAPFVVIANGTDPAFKKPLIKRMPDDLVRGLAESFAAEGVGTVQVGKEGVTFVSAPGSLNLIGETSLDGLVHLIRHAVGVVACEGGVAHLASQIRAKTAGVFGPTDWRFWGYPDNLNLVAENSQCPMRPCWFTPNEPNWHLECIAARRGLVPSGDYPECMTAFDPTETAARIKEHLL